MAALSAAVEEAAWRTRQDGRAAAFRVNFSGFPCRSTARRLARLSGIVSRGFAMKKDRSQGAILMVIGVALLNSTPNAKAAACNRIRPSR